MGDITDGAFYRKQREELNFKKMDVTMTAFAKQMDLLTKTGVEWKCDGETFISKVCCVCWSADSSARALMQNMVQHNAYFGCGWYPHPGKTVEGTVKYPVGSASVPDRTKEGVERNMAEAFEMGTHVQGQARTKQCTLCHGIGLRADVCPNKTSFTRCPICSKVFPYNHDPLTTPHDCDPHCSNCNGEHPPSSSDCQARAKADEDAQKWQRILKRHRFRAVARPPQDLQNWQALPIKNRSDILRTAEPKSQPESPTAQHQDPLRYSQEPGPNTKAGQAKIFQHSQGRSNVTTLEDINPNPIGTTSERPKFGPSPSSNP
ncbi:hypothetical protein HPB47_011341 [Ixodes persulcatus]|uniref:Uncharacterized protein n=1 Tax=Ixodes persulcatus TaxID=34615 RepID=A0AC60NWQ6_IXOPE|nr:hypothetical protein HPB47_011341 [Ixodes persulcatus]